VKKTNPRIVFSIKTVCNLTKLKSHISMTRCCGLTIFKQFFLTLKIFADTSKNLDFFINFKFRMTQLINKISLLTSHALDFYIQFRFSLTQFTDCIFRTSLTSMYSDIDINYLQHLTPPTTQAGWRNNMTMITNNQLFSGLTMTCKQNACLWRSLNR
jgi:hypothetical protein